MQIKVLNELRERDNKQHLKALTKLDSQLKKKSSDADEVGNFLDQLRVKQKRIQELESQLARVERQSNQERLVTEKQTHENWINSKKVEKDSKEARAEIVALEKKQSELEATNKSLMESTIRHDNKAMTMPYYSIMNLSKSHDLNNSDDSVNDPEDEHRPPSTSINPGIPDGHNFQPLMIRPHFRMPSAPPIRPPNANLMHQSVDQNNKTFLAENFFGSYFLS